MKGVGSTALSGTSFMEHAGHTPPTPRVAVGPYTKELSPERGWEQEQDLLHVKTERRR